MLQMIMILVNICNMKRNELEKKQVSGGMAVDLKAGRNEPTKMYSTDILFDNDNEIIIQHEEESYRLRITRNRKLILTK